MHRRHVVERFVEYESQTGVMTARILEADSVVEAN